jgi:acyl-coenzyme A synthetase/AMP-(fatty) acid ligase
MNLAQLKDYEGDAIIDQNGSYSFDQLNDKIDAYDSYLKTRITTGDIVVIDSDYSFNAIVLLLSLSKLSIVIIPIVRTTEQEFKDKIQASEPNKIISIESDSTLNVQVLSEEKSTYNNYTEIVSKENSGIVLFSSGTTGVPKVMVHNFTVLIESFKKPRKQRGLKFLLFLLFDHIGGLNTLLSCLNNGSPVVLPHDRNTGVVLDIIEKHKVQVLPTSPTFLNLLLMDPNFEKRDLSSLKLVTYGTEKMPPKLLRKIHEAVPAVKLLQTFGTSETGILKTKSKSSSSLFFKIVDEDIEYKIKNNQLFIKSKTSVNGYKDVDSDQFQSDGWFATGDLVEVDEEGYLKVVGRLKEVINIGGLKVLPIEVEDVINSIERVIDCTVFAKENAITGQMVCVNIAALENTDLSQLKKEIKLVCKNNLDKYKRPVKINMTHGLEHTTRFKKSIN